MKMILEDCEIVTLKKFLKTVRYAVFSDGTFRELLKNGKLSELCPDFAFYYIKMRESGWKNA